VQRVGVSAFVKTSRCHSGGCVAVAADDGVVRVRSTLVADGPVVSFTKAEWDEFVAGVRRGEFDYDDVAALSSR
jgi:hypothetical protein